jgi:hypothetical protein
MGRGWRLEPEDPQPICQYYPTVIHILKHWDAQGSGGGGGGGGGGVSGALVWLRTVRSGTRYVVVWTSESHLQASGCHLVAIGGSRCVQCGSYEVTQAGRWASYEGPKAVQLRAVKTRPLEPYCTRGSREPMGPKFVPVTVTMSPPVVAILVAEGDRANMCGA